MDGRALAASIRLRSVTSPLRVLLVGCGGISRAWLESLLPMPELELVGLVDLNEEAARERVVEFELAVPIETDLESMLEKTRPDVVFNCTIPEAHHDVTLAALSAGAHVFGEKPLADTLEQAEAMVAAARNSGKTFAVMQNRRFDPNIRALRTFLQRGTLGNLTEIHADFFIGAHFGGFREVMQHVLIKDMAIHTFDAARFLTDTNPKSVYCLEWNPRGSWYERDASATAIFEMTGGQVFTYRGSWCAEGLHTPWESTWRIVGTKGTVLWNGESIRCEVVGQAGGFIREHVIVSPPTPETSAAPSWHGAAIEDFVETLLTYRKPESDAEDNLYSLKMVLGAAESAETHRVVDLTESTENVL